MPGTRQLPAGLKRAGDVAPLLRRNVIVSYGPNLAAVFNKVPALLDVGPLRAAGAG